MELRSQAYGPDVEDPLFVLCGREQGYVPFHEEYPTEVAAGNPAERLTRRRIGEYFGHEPVAEIYGDRLDVGGQRVHMPILQHLLAERRLVRLSRYSSAWQSCKTAGKVGTSAIFAGGRRGSPPLKAPGDPMENLTGDDLIQDGLKSRLGLKIVANGSITFPAVPGFVDEYTARLASVFAEVGRPCTADELTHLRSNLDRLLNEAFTLSQRSTITVSYASTGAGPLNYQVSVHCMTIEEAYHRWVATREPPLFGVEPDARVWALAGETDPAASRILDIGGGTGRNALALARRGHAVDVVELTEKFADMIRQSAAAESLDVRVIQRNVFEAGEDLRDDYSLILLSGVVPEFRTTEELRRLFDLAARSLTAGGRLVFNVFLTRDSYTPDTSVRQFAQHVYSSFFTHSELAAASADLPLELDADDCVLDYEKSHLPEGAWPPMNWYYGWITGHDVFGLPTETSPIDLRWLVYRKTD